jgi:hypothetical protein
VKNLARYLSALTLALLLARHAPAEDEKDEEKKDKKPAATPIDRALNFPRLLKLTDDQKAKIAELKKQYNAKLETLRIGRDFIMTPERQKAGEAARKKALDAGKTSKEAQRAYSEALQLTTDEKIELKQVEAEISRLPTEARLKAMELLTAEQKEQLKPKAKDKAPDK